jgi:DNA polymerase III epsilon subunit-like protein/transposase-like protein
MEKISEPYNISATPSPYKGIQVNFCKTPGCPNYGIPSIITKRPRGRPPKNATPRDGYTLSTGEQSDSDIILHQCEICGEKFPIKSNQGIHEELSRIKGALPLLPNPKEYTCTNPECGSYQAVSIEAGSKYYYKHSKEKNGVVRYKCRLCGKTFTVSSRTNFTKSQQASHKNRRFFELLLGKMPIKRIIEHLDLSPQTIYDKINFLYEQSINFAHQRERKLFDKKTFERLYVSADQQDLMLNWTDRKVRRNIIFKAVGAADNDTGYVFASFINYDPNLDRFEVEKEAKLIGDNEKKPPFRKFARVWLFNDYEKDSSRPKTKLPKGINKDLKTEILSSYDFSESQKDVESAEAPSNITQLPHKGVQIHNEYTLYAMFYYLQELFERTEKVRFFLDRDSGIRAACIAAFQKEIKNRTCDALYIAINTSMTIDDKEAAVNGVNAFLQRMKTKHPGKSVNEIKLMVLRERLEKMDDIGKWKDKWLLHPFPTIDEPEKSSHLLTDFKDYDLDHQAWLHNKASLRGINQYFMNVRRRLSLLERPLSTPSNLGRKWYGYNLYSPEIASKLLAIFRTFYNYCRVGKYGRTPAVRLGASKGPVRIEDIIYGRKYANYTFDKKAEKIKKEDKQKDIEQRLKAAEKRKKAKKKQKQQMPTYKGLRTVLEDFEKKATVFLDIETTGDDENDKIIEIAIVDDNGQALVDTLVNPEMPISRGARAIHGITQEMVNNSPTFSEIENQIINAIEGKLVVTYGKDFDRSFFSERITSMIDAECCMTWYAALRGEWNPHFGSYQWVVLESAAQEVGYIWQGKQHRTLSDALACRAVWKFLLKIKQ